MLMAKLCPFCTPDYSIELFICETVIQKNSLWHNFINLVKVSIYQSKKYDKFTYFYI